MNGEIWESSTERSPQSDAGGGEAPALPGRAWGAGVSLPDQQASERDVRSSGTMTTAGFWRRGIAFSLDLLVVWMICLFFLWIAFSAVQLALSKREYIFLDNPFLGPLSFTSLFLWPLLFLSYFSFLTWWGGQTLGKRITHLRVVSQRGGEVSVAQALGRTVAYLLSFLTGGFGFLIVLFSREGRSLHDRVSGTRVVRL